MMYFLGIGFILFLLFQVFVYFSTGNTEQQKYTSIERSENFEIRKYGSTKFATVYSNEKTYRKMANSTFGKLASFIFGSNEDNKTIAMTAPVHIEMNNQFSSMSFVLPFEYQNKNIPMPLNKNIIIHEKEAESVAVIQFSGFFSEAKFNSNKQKLIEILNKRGLKHKGDFRYLGYNPPYQFIGRRNEIIVGLMN